MSIKNVSDPSTVLKEMFDAAVGAANPMVCVPPHLPKAPSGRTIVLGAGKASAMMAKAVEEHWTGNISGCVVTRYNYAVSCTRIEIIEASHPVPDAASANAAQRILKLANDLKADDLCIALISGGASSLLSYPSKGLTLKDKQKINHQLLRSGATINEINIVRKHLSAIKGGRLAEAIFPASLRTILISDVPGDDPATIGSGPTVPDDTTFSDAREVLKKYEIIPPKAILNHLIQSNHETPKKQSRVFQNTEVRFAGLPITSLEAAARCAVSYGFTPHLLGDTLQGEARDLAKIHANLGLNIKKRKHKMTPPCAILSGGEATVTIKGAGRGGPNTEYSLAMAIALNGASNIYGITCDTDGIDGTENNAGSIITPETLQKAKSLNLDPARFLEDNNSYTFFKKLDDLIDCGPTYTNVNDFRVLLILP